MSYLLSLDEVCEPVRRGPSTHCPLDTHFISQKQMEVQVIDTVTDYELKDNSDKRQQRVLPPILETIHGHR